MLISILNIEWDASIYLSVTKCKEIVFARINLNVDFMLFFTPYFILWRVSDDFSNNTSFNKCFYFTFMYVISL